MVIAIRLQIQQARQIPNGKNSENTMPRQIIIIVLKTNSKKKQVDPEKMKHYIQKTMIQVTIFLSETIDIKRQCDVFKVLKIKNYNFVKNYQPRIPYPEKYSSGMKVM